MNTIPLNTESSSETLTRLLFEVKIRDVMTTPVIFATPQMTVREVQSILRDKQFTGMPIVVDGRIQGIISMSSIIEAFESGSIDAPCEKYAKNDVIVLQENMPVFFAVSYLNKYKFRRFPVISTQNQLTGIVTAHDVLASLLAAASREIELLEAEGKSIPDAYRTESRILEFTTEPFNFETAGLASTEIKKLLKVMHIDSEISRRVGVASYELEMNQVIHSAGGIMRYEITPGSLVIEAKDTGPGIPNIQNAMTEGFSTATDQVRSLGFGAGMGLPNTKRVADGFSITSSVPGGTVVRATFALFPATGIQ